MNTERMEPGAGGFHQWLRALVKKPVGCGIKGISLVVSTVTVMFPAVVGSYHILHPSSGSPITFENLLKPAVSLSAVSLALLFFYLAGAVVFRLPKYSAVLFCLLVAIASVVGGTQLTIEVFSKR